MVQFWPRKVYIFNFYAKFCIFLFPMSPHCETKLLNLIQWMTQKAQVLLHTRSLGRKKLLCHFLYFFKGCNTSPIDFHLNYNMVQIEPAYHTYAGTEHARHQYVFQSAGSCAPVIFLTYEYDFFYTSTFFTDKVPLLLLLRSWYENTKKLTLYI